jgi:glycosyltransferase 2 family protein
MRKDGQVPGRLSPWILRIVQVAVALGLLSLVWQVADGGDALQILSHAHPVLLLSASALLTLQIFLSALRWQITARPLGIQLRPSVALREYYLAQILNQSLPGGVLGDAGRAVRSRTHAGMLASAQAVILERLAGQLGLVFVLAGAFVITWSVPGGLEWPRWLAGAVGVGLLGVLLAPLFLGGLARVLPRRSRDFLQGLGRSARLALTHPSVRWSQLALSLATALLNITGFVVCAWALGIEVSWGASLALVPLILFTMLVPITVSGWGVREAATVALFPLMGLSPAEGLATSVAFGLVLIVTSLPGLWFLRSRKASKIG